ncbi:MAG: putative peroxiredoxin [Alphaproteobacteria bacterium MarineAlpha5_Bin5]|nr:MAG: putative peroxiredoxin [Alphaproteobacteria bacterium MarineAlpha5_Bin5]PPR51691.1 MAG: putative peroxiredoxin [Alphaproteobacteria bacterium MarineAlpha5_Bin4]|tara:strand:- start:1443 stop:1922 length:480 start_codon:yes stop_codon:yes gene_type:complete
MPNKISDIIVPIIKNENSFKLKLSEELKNKKVIIFGVPGAFTPTCSEKHFPGFIKLYSSFKDIKIDDIYCLSVNDAFVMKAWLLSFGENHKIIGIADGNGDVAKSFELLVDISVNHMGMRSNRFAMIVENNTVKKLFIEKPGEYKVSSAEYILKKCKLI